MSKFEAFMMACIAVAMLIVFGLILFSIIMILSAMKPIGWVIIGVITLVTLLLTIGIYQYDKHF
nr:MAG TPA: hypothetical protein [Caudoviricetes sp.]